MLTIHNTRVPDSQVQWSWKDMSFIPMPDPPHIINILDVPGTLLHRESQEAIQQIAGHGSIISEKYR